MIAGGGGSGYRIGKGGATDRPVQGWSPQLRKNVVVDIGSRAPEDPSPSLAGRAKKPPPRGWRTCL